MLILGHSASRRVTNPGHPLQVRPPGPTVSNVTSALRAPAGPHSWLGWDGHFTPPHATPEGFLITRCTARTTNPGIGLTPLGALPSKDPPDILPSPSHFIGCLGCGGHALSDPWALGRLSSCSTLHPEAPETFKTNLDHATALPTASTGFLVLERKAHVY